MDSNHRCLDVGQESSPLDHGTNFSSRGGNRTHKRSPGSRPGRFTKFAYSAIPGDGMRNKESRKAGTEPAHPSCLLAFLIHPSSFSFALQLRRPDLNRRRTAYETVLEPDSSPLRSDQGESRTPMPFEARRSERRVSAGSTTWPLVRSQGWGIRSQTFPRPLSDS
jgi:hypothetical protein